MTLGRQRGTVGQSHSSVIGMSGEGVGNQASDQNLGSWQQRQEQGSKSEDIAVIQARDEGDSD